MMVHSGSRWVHEDNSFLFALVLNWIYRMTYLESVTVNGR